nr:putative reverse transcriptase domain-containing protein [Tanacetum cinerariifolium]
MHLHIYISYELYNNFDYTVTLRIYSPYDLLIIMTNPLPNHGVNLPDDEQVQTEPVHALLGFAPAVLDILNNNNEWIEEEPEEDLKMEEEEEEEEEEMDIEDEMDDPEIIDPYEIEKGKLPSPPADSNTSSDSEPEVEAEDEEEDEAATVGTITRAPYSIQPFSGLAQQMFEQANAEYSTLKRLGEMDRYLGGISMERRSETREYHKLRQSVSTLEDQIRGLMLEDKEEKERIMPPKAMSQVAIERLITQRVNDALEAERASQANEGGQGSNPNETGGQDRAPPIYECTFSKFYKCNPTPFHGRALTWWNSQVATLGLNVAIGKSWGDMKKMMLEEFCPNEEVHRMEDELRSLKLRDTNIAAYTQRFHELVLLCPKAVSTEKKKVKAYIKGLPKNIKGEKTSSRSINLNEVVGMAHTLMEQKIQAKPERMPRETKENGKTRRVAIEKTTTKATTKTTPATINTTTRGKEMREH